MPEPIIDRIPLHVDDRGSVWCPLDYNGVDTFGTPCLVKRTYVVHNWEKGRIRAWHGHLKGWTGMHVVHGAAKLIARPMRSGISDSVKNCKDTVVVFSDRNPGILWVPPGYFNGAMSLEDNTKIICYSTLTFEEVQKDNVRVNLSAKDRKLFSVEDR